ncbi:hypothetical protein ABID77_001349 [Variovorax sp. PvP013]
MLKVRCNVIEVLVDLAMRRSKGFLATPFCRKNYLEMGIVMLRSTGTAVTLF